MNIFSKNFKLYFFITKESYESSCSYNRNGEKMIKCKFGITKRESLKRLKQHTNLNCAYIPSIRVFFCNNEENMKKLEKYILDNLQKEKNIKFIENYNRNSEFFEIKFEDRYNVFNKICKLYEKKYTELLNIKCESDIKYESDTEDKDVEDNTDTEDVDTDLDQKKKQYIYVNELKDICKKLNIKGYSKMKKYKLIENILDNNSILKIKKESLIKICNYLKLNISSDKKKVEIIKILKNRNLYLLENYSKDKLKEICKNNNIKGYSNLNKTNLIKLIRYNYPDTTFF